MSPLLFSYAKRCTQSLSLKLLANQNCSHLQFEDCNWIGLRIFLCVVACKRPIKSKIIKKKQNKHTQFKYRRTIQSRGASVEWIVRFLNAHDWFCIVCARYELTWKWGGCNSWLTAFIDSNWFELCCTVNGLRFISCIRHSSFYLCTVFR